MNLLRREGIWIVLGLSLWATLHFAWPRLIGRSLSELSQLRRLEQALPDSVRLQGQLAQLLTDSVALSDLESKAWSRAITASEPQARAVEEVLLATSKAHWNLERIQPSREQQSLQVSLAVNSDFDNLCAGLQGMAQSPRALALRDLSLRQAGGRLQMTANAVLLARSAAP